MTTIKDLRVGDRARQRDTGNAFVVVADCDGSDRLVRFDADVRDMMLCDTSCEVEVISRADQFKWVNFAGGRVKVVPVGSDTQAPLLLGPAPTVHQVSAELARVAAAVAPRCPSCDSAAHLRRTDSGWYCGGTCGGWHGASLTAPPAAARFGVGDRVHIMGDTSERWQVMAIVHGTSGVTYGLHTEAPRKGKDDVALRRALISEEKLEACEAPR